MGGALLRSYQNQGDIGLGKFRLDTNVNTPIAITLDHLVNITRVGLLHRLTLNALILCT